MRGYEGGFIPFFSGDPDWPISSILFQCLENRCDAQRVRTFVQAWIRIQIPDRHHINFAVVDARMDSSVFLVDKENGLGQLLLLVFDNVHGEHAIYFLLFQQSQLRTDKIRSGVDRSAVHLFQLE